MILRGFTQQLTRLDPRRVLLRVLPGEGFLAYFITKELHTSHILFNLTTTRKLLTPIPQYKKKEKRDERRKRQKKGRERDKEREREMKEALKHDSNAL